MKEQRMVQVEGVGAQADIFRCDGECRKLLDPTGKPMIVAQQSFILQHPDGFNEVVHVSNEPGGRFRYYCLGCFEKGNACGATNDERAKCKAALQRHAADLLALKKEEERRQQAADLLALKKEEERRQQAAEAARRSRKEKPKPN